MIVVDASVIANLLLRTGAVAAIESRLLAAGDWHAPHLVDLEVLHVLRREALSGRLSRTQAETLLQQFCAFSIVRHPHDLYLSRIWALRENVTAYDGAYVALAEALDAPLVTADAKLAATSGHAAEIDLL